MAVTSVVFGATAVDAEPALPRRHRVLLGADRLVPFYSYTRVSRPFSGGEVVDVASSASLLGFDTSQSVYYSTPRVAVDVMLTDRVTIGASALVFVTTSKQSFTTAPMMASPEPAERALGLAPRVGYVAPLSCSLSLWSRAGLSYYYSWTKAVPYQSIIEIGEHNDQLAIDVDVLLAWSVSEHVALTAGPVADVPISGSTGAYTSAIPSYEVEQLQVGFAGGIVGWF
jgi:hypothetical protein